MIKARFKIIRYYDLGSSHLNPDSYYFNVEDNDATNVFVQAKAFFDELKINTNLLPQVLVPSHKIKFELRLVNFEGAIT